MPLQDIAAAIITKNAAGTLDPTLDSLRQLPEVSIYDNGAFFKYMKIYADKATGRASGG